ncbi:hypothetical protein V7S43_013727 [Phytophthora oleae]|uniref:Thioredoxin-like fold domain-containing protein n=1 Tax=Phytophthora oleae TaxID=2107226 RepID=A0ABD3F320_9STRA
MAFLDMINERTGRPIVCRNYSRGDKPSVLHFGCTEVPEPYGFQSVPHTIVIDPQGIVRRNSDNFHWDHRCSVTPSPGSGGSKLFEQDYGVVKTVQMPVVLMFQRHGRGHSRTNSRSRHPGLPSPSPPVDQLSPEPEPIPELACATNKR